MSKLQRTKTLVRGIADSARGAGVRAHVWRLTAAVLVCLAVIVSLTRHEAAGITTQQPTKLDGGSPTVSDAFLSPTAVSPNNLSIPDATKLETRLAYASGRIETSLFQDAQQAGLSDALILKLVEIFGWDIDFALGIRPGDTFAVVHEEKYWMGQKVADGPILAARFINRGEMHEAIGYRDVAGVTTYYEPNGFTKRRRFLRTPIEFSRISSRYTDTATRFHPILKIWTAHRGIDYAAPTGTPIRAAAAGRVLFMDVNGGYGKAVVVKHDSTYETLYAHMSRYASNIRVGSFVEQGQIIGYVGQTGLATGPHLHYEFHVNGQHRDPLKFKFPGATPIPVVYRDAFLAQARSLVAQLDLITDRRLAANR